MNGAGNGSAKYLDLLSDIVRKACAAGADTADAVVFESTSLEVSYRLGKPEDLERSEGQDLGLRVFVGRRPAVVSSTDFDPRTLDEMIERGIAMARAAPEDPYAGLADAALLCRDVADLMQCP